MDLQDFNSEMLYFQTPSSPEVEALVHRAASEYGRASERYLLQALALAPDNLVVLIGLYRFYYYQHRYADALQAADRVMRTVAGAIEFPQRWQAVDCAHLRRGIHHSFPSSGFICLH